MVDVLVKREAQHGVDEDPNDLYVFVGHADIIGYDENIHVFAACGEEGGVPERVAGRALCQVTRREQSEISVCFTKRGARVEALKRRNGEGANPEFVCGTCVSRLYAHK